MAEMRGLARGTLASGQAGVEVRAGVAGRSESATPDETGRDEASSGALMPRRIRYWVVGGVAALMTIAAYLIVVRGSAILFDLRDAVNAICF